MWQAGSLIIAVAHQDAEDGSSTTWRDRKMAGLKPIYLIQGSGVYRCNVHNDLKCQHEHDSQTSHIETTLKSLQSTNLQIC